jgi:hypothetical protein
VAGDNGDYFETGGGVKYPSFVTPVQNLCVLCGKINHREHRVKNTKVTELNGDHTLFCLIR